MNEGIKRVSSNELTPVPHHYTARASRWYRAARAFFRATAHALFKIRVAGEENIPAGNYIVVANHLSWIDPFLLMITLPSEPRLYFIGAQQAINRGWKAGLMGKFDVIIPFERGASWVGKDVLQLPASLAGGRRARTFPGRKTGAVGR